MTKKITDLQIKRNSKLQLMKKIVSDALYEERARTTLEENQYNDLNQEVNIIDRELANLKAEEELNMRTGTSVNVSKTNQVESFRTWLSESLSGNSKKSYLLEMRADPWLSTTDTGIINKSVAAVDLMVGPYQQLFNDLGVKMYTKVNGQLILPRLTEVMATFPGEDASALTANMATQSLTINPLRATHYQTISRETIADTNPDVLQSIINNLQFGIWKAVAYRFFDDLDTACATQFNADQSAAVSFTNIVNLEASLGNFTLVNPKYVMQPQTKAYLKRITKLTNAQNTIWELDKVNEYTAIASPAVNYERIILGDFSKSVLAQFGDGIEVIVDPFSKSTKGEIVLTAIGMFGSGVHNPNAFSIMGDASTY
jgi:HK97 family phage major capsid protein